MPNSPELDREWTRDVLKTFFPKAFDSMNAAPRGGEAPLGSNEIQNDKGGK